MTPEGAVQHLQDSPYRQTRVLTSLAVGDVEDVLDEAAYLNYRLFQVIPRIEGFWDLVLTYRDPED